MAVFEVMIEEVLVRVVEIDASTEDAAVEEARRLYDAEKIVLGPQDLVDTAQISIL